MTLSQRPSPLDIMTLREVREANESGAGVAALDHGLAALFWGNRAGRLLLGVPTEPGEGADILPANSPATRQIKAAARMLATRGEARLLLRSGTAVGAKPIVADLKHIAAPGLGFVLLAVGASKAATTDEAALAARLLGESGCPDASVHAASGVLATGPAATSDHEAPDPAEIAAFLASGDDVRQIAAPGLRTTWARVASRLVLVRHETVEEPASIEVDDGISAAENAVEPSAERRTGAFFSVKRRKLPNERSPMNMNALVQRWHSRQDAPTESTSGEDAGEMPESGERDETDDGLGQAALAPTPLTSFNDDVSEGAADAGDDGEAPTPDATTTMDMVVAAGAGVAAPRSTMLDGASAEDASDTPDVGIAAAPDDSAGPSEEPVPVGSKPQRMRSAWGAESAIGIPEVPDISQERDATGETIRSPATASPASADLATSQDDAGASDAAAGYATLESGVPQNSDAGDGGGSPVPAADPSDRPHAVPNDDPSIVEGETAQPFDRESVVTLPDVPVEDAADLDVPISDDEEVPSDEALVPQEDEAPSTEQADASAQGLAVGVDEIDGGEPAYDATEGDALEGDASKSSAEASGPADELVSDEPADARRDVLPPETESPDSATVPATASGDDSSLDREPPEFEPRFDIAPVRFVWQIDRDGRFRTLSPEFATAVGPKAADVVGRSFKDVSQVFGFDVGGEISRLLDRRDTWSGRSILWPVENSDRKVPVDLAALPVYAADRSFDGFRGFGIVRMSEAVADKEAVGLVLGGRTPAPPNSDGAEGVLAAAGGAASVPLGETVPGAGKPLLRTFAGDMPGTTFGRRQEPPRPSEIEASQAGTETSADGAPKIIRLEERRRPKDGALSQAEEAAFRAIGMKLGTHSEAESPGALRFADAPQLDDDTVPDVGNAGIRDAAEAETPADAAADLPRDDAVPEPEDGEPDAPVLDDSPAIDAAAPASDLPAEAEDGEASHDPEAEAAGPSADELDALYGTLPLPVLVQMRETLVYANREFEDLTGYDGIAALQARGGLDALFAESAEGLRAGEMAIRRSNGQVFDVRVHMQRITLSGRSCLLMSFSPPPREIAAAAMPALEETSAETRANETEDLRHQVEELQAVLDTATDGIVLLDPAGMIRAMNGSAHALFGIGQNDHDGRHLSSLFAHESQKATHDYLETLRDNGLAGILNDGREVIGRVAQGGFIPLFITVGRLSGDRGWCVVIRDIAHWKRVEEDLINARRQAEAASLHKSRFLANISHELRTPLNAIIGFADVMASECFGPIGNERYLEYLNDIKRSGHHVLDLVNDLLDISKIEAGKLDLAFEAVSLNEVVSEVVSLMQPQANRERVIVRSNLPSSVPPVVADRRTMRQIALNLVANAIRFTPAGGQIIASTTYTAEGDVVMRFRDSGIGMTDREIEIALTPFQQVHSPSANRGEGTGLGLPLTKAMVEANRAAFAIHSTPGEGTLVEISFPSQRVLAD